MNHPGDVSQPPAYSNSDQSKPPLRSRDSWEYYSTDDEAPEPRPKPRHLKSNRDRSRQNPLEAPASLRVGGPPPIPQAADSTAQVVSTPATSGDASDRTPSIPEALRPGGAPGSAQRKQTNPFLRKPVPAASTPPTEQLSKLDLSEDPVRPPVWKPTLSRQQTEASSIYSQASGPPPELPPSTSSYPDGGPKASTENIWDALPPNKTQSNAVAWPGPHDAAAAYLDSPVELLDDPWAAPSAPPGPPTKQPPIIPQAETNPWASTAPSSNAPSQRPSPPRQASPLPAQGSVGPSKTPPNVPPQSYMQPPPLPTASMVSLPSDDEPGWGSTKRDMSKSPVRPAATVSDLSLAEDRDIWGDVSALDKDKDKGKAPAIPPQEMAGSSDWNLIDVESLPGPNGPPPGSSRGQTPGAAPSEDNPALPTRPTEDDARWTSPRPPVDAKAETYQVKNIRWQDSNSSNGDTRVSPILVQNANGPCPLVALVNALSLTTPPDHSDATLVEVLRSREQVSLNLLLDAVFEELMSPRRLGEDGSLPDITDLYAFLQSLHTGMNVNPRFAPSDAVRQAFERTTLTHLEPSERGTYIPGTFENTQEMGLYATFKIPLIHGWLPPLGDPAYEAMERQGASYEDAQNLLFREEELDRKLSNSSIGLTEDEQQLYQDVYTIKGFLESSATQLTSWGIQVISRAIRPGTFAILFRNDHFSTLYCHPQTKQLVTLVTDYGYRSHEEVVWESLVDINGERTQYLSGDFKVVGSDASSSFGGYSEGQGSEWTTVSNKRGKARQTISEPEAGPALSAAEQEDRDLALALQLQEEEDQKHREEEARRKREQELSNRVIEQQGRQPYRSISNTTPSSSGMSTGIAPARRSSNNLNVTVGSNNTPRTPPRPVTQQIRPMVPPRRSNVPATNRAQEEGADAPPPYEQAAQSEPYVPPPGHPNHPGSSPNMSRQSTNASNNGAFPPRQGQRLPGQAAAAPAAFRQNPYGTRERDRDCIVM
ncbi:unnamed protein product [Clonostachys rhizophaga]|uniref:MINDY deubiquitinase domain-containing protein n=1 Tax=Clonostachys rhizophaga TaxID=160324 RepID=A0A9N9V5V7_9HYPO|nr:unnamed protein product [Clonostachys rhizophaga]